MSSSALSPAPAGGAAIGAAEPGLRAALLDWLDDGLRAGRRGQLLAEHPLALAPERIGDSVVARCSGRLAAHALGRLVSARLPGRDELPVGLVGLVYTEPAFRGRGLARACVAAAMERLAADGALAVVLWTELDALYAPLGFRRAGREWIVGLEPGACRAACGPARAALEVGPARPEEWPALEALHEARPCRVRRPPGALARLAAAPGCTLRVARRAGRPVAWAAAGRGDDLRGVVHDAAGEPDGLLACLEALAAAGARQWLAGPLEQPAAARLRALGAAVLPGDFALVALPDPPRLFAALVDGVPELAGVRLAGAGRELLLVGAGGRVLLSPAEATALLLGPERPARAAGALSAGQWLALRRHLPAPLYVPGFDSI